MLLVQCIEFVGEAEKCSGDVSSLVGVSSIGSPRGDTAFR